MTEEPKFYLIFFGMIAVVTLAAIVFSSDASKDKHTNPCESTEVIEEFK